MNTRQLIRNVAASTSATLLLCAAFSASAQLAVYRLSDPAGHAVYADRPEIPSSPEGIADPAKPVAPVKLNPSRRAYPLVNASEAKRRLVQSQLKRTQGKAPLPGESIQGPGGDTATYQYWRRQEKLRIEVEQAQRRANAVQPPLMAAASKM
jgi:hypothetical protein